VVEGPAEPVTFEKVSPGIVRVQLGEDVTLDCVATGSPTPTITWSRVDGELPGSSRVESNGLVIPNVTQSDFGEYVCSAHNEHGGKFHSVTLELGDSRSVVAQTTARLQCLLCSLCALDEFTFSWRKEGAMLADQNDCTLTIEDVTLSDEGNYTCVATSKSGEGQLQQKIPLTVVAAARITSDFSKILFVRRGERVELTCTAAGPPAPDVFWTNEESKHVGSSQPGTLIIEMLSEENAGIYRCHAINHLGQDMRETRIEIVQLQFVEKPPLSVNFSAAGSSELILDCKAAVGVEHSIPWPAPRTSWSACDDGDLLDTTVMPNGSLLIEHVDPCYKQYCNCTAEYDGESISAQVLIKGGGGLMSRIPDWMLTDDQCNGFRQSTYDSSVYYAVSKVNVWNLHKNYDCPCGYHWATTAEGISIFKADGSSTTYVYYGQCGWHQYSFANLNRQYFRFRDSTKTYSSKHAGSYEQAPVHYTIKSVISNFAGIVCIKDAD
jgi:hypothetical protein